MVSENAGLVQGLTTGPHHIQLTGGRFLSVPGPIVTQIECCATLDLVDKPRVRAAAMTKQNVLAPTMRCRFPPVLAAIEGIGVTDGHFHGPAVVILV